MNTCECEALFSSVYRPVSQVSKYQYQSKVLQLNLQTKAINKITWAHGIIVFDEHEFNVCP